MQVRPHVVPIARSLYHILESIERVSDARDVHRSCRHSLAFAAPMPMMRSAFIGLAPDSYCIYINYENHLRRGEAAAHAAIVYAPRGTARHIISMRKANAREKARFTPSDRF
jgi:uncharacterized DUF497 family protein